MPLIDTQSLPVRPTRKQGSGRTYPTETPLGALCALHGWRLNKLSILTDINSDVLGQYVRGKKRIASHHIGILAETLGCEPQDIDYIPPDDELPRRADNDSLVSEIWNILLETHDPQIAYDFAVENSSTNTRSISKSIVRLLYTLLVNWEEGSLPGDFVTPLGSLRATFLDRLGGR